jgi:hypothetical protein
MKIKEYNELYEVKKAESSFSEFGILIGFLLFVPLFTILFSMVKDLFAIAGVLLGVVTSAFWGNWLEVHFNRGNKLERRIKRDKKGKK